MSPTETTEREETTTAAPRRKVVAVILTYNCARLLPKAVRKIPRDLVDDVIVTDDGSSDGSYEFARELGITAFRHTPNRGYGGNLKAGIRHALERGAEYIVEVHGDGQFNPSALRHALPFMEQGVHFIIGSRFQQPAQARANGMPLSRYVANRALSFFDRLVLRLPFTEFHTGFRIYHRTLLENVPWEENADTYLFSFQIIAQAAYVGARVAEVPVEADYRSEHTSHSIRGAALYALQTFGVLAEFLLARLRLRYSRHFPAKPSCRGCRATPLREIFHLGNIPPVNTFLTRDQLPRERPYPLAVAWCERCTLVQLRTIIPPPELFTQYQHLSSASQSNVQHLHALAAILTERLHLTERSAVLDVGSNDGSLLTAFLPTTQHVLGVDPAENLVALAGERGVEQRASFLTPETAAAIVHERGFFDLVLALNVVAHTPDVTSLLRAVKTVLAPNGTFVMEAVYVFDTILRGEFDTVYHEHVYCFSFTALQSLLARVGLTVVEVERIPTQGGSLRVSARHTEGRPAVAGLVARLLAEEAVAGVRNPARYAAAGDRVRAFQEELKTRLGDLRARHGRVVGLGAPARGVVILNACRIGPELLEAVVDDTPLKQGRLVPGTHIPVVSWDALAAEPRPTAFLLLSWNYEREVLGKLQQYVRDAEILIPFPDFRIRSLVPEPTVAHAVA